MVLVSVFCAQLIGCPVQALRNRLNHPQDRATVLSALKGRRVRTTYFDRNGMTKTFFVDGLTTQAAAHIMAYGKLGQPFNINVAAHFYCRQRIKLHHPYLPCVIEHFGGKGEDRFYPLELLELVQDDKIWTHNTMLGNMFEELGSKALRPGSASSSTSSTLTANSCLLRICDEGIDEVDGVGRAECSQSKHRHW